MFKKWLTFQSSEQYNSIYTFQDFPLTKITKIFMQEVFNKQSFLSNNPLIDEHNSHTKFINDTIIRTMSKAEQIAESYLQEINNERAKLMSTQGKFKKPPAVETILDAIEHRRINMIERAQCNLGYKSKIISNNLLIHNVTLNI